MTADQLKASLLQMAIQGKLVPQRDDEPAVAIDAEEPEEVPFAIPEKWKWVRLKALCEKLQYGYTASAKQTGDIKLLRITDITTNGIKWETVPFCDIEKSNIPKFKLKDNDILIARTGGTIGKSFRIRNLSYPSVFASYLIRIRLQSKNILLYEYLEKYLCSPWYWTQLHAKSRGTGQPNVNTQSLCSLLIPLPPLAEQRRIVARLNELLPLVEEYGKSQSALHVLKTELPGKLQASLLQQAIMGKLVPQLDDEPAVDIDAEEPEEVPFAIPEKWKWVKIKNLVTPCGQKIPDRDFLYIDVSSIDNIHHKIRPALKILQPHEAPSRARKIVKQGMVLYSTVRPYLLNTCILDTQMHDEMICSTAFVAVTCSDKLISSYFLSVLLSPCFISYVLSVQKGVAYPAITDKNFYDAVIPLPPVAEQRRIVARLNELFHYINSILH